MELLVALLVVSAASAITVKLIYTSTDLSKRNRYYSVGSELAHMQAVRVTQQPEAFQWPDLTTLEPGTFAEVVPRTDRYFIPPSTPPTTLLKADRTTKLYETYQWDAYVLLPAADAEYAEVTVVARWVRQGRPRESITVTSAIARKAIPQGDSQ